MGEIISIHSFRGGTGKSNLTSNIAANIARQGHRVGIVDTDIQSPGIHILFGFDETKITTTLNDYLWGQAAIEETAYAINEVSGNDEGREFLKDLNMWLIPSSSKTGDMARILKEGYDVGLLNEGFHTLLEELNLDYLFIDTHPGLSEETLLSIAISSQLIIILRPDQQDMQGTAVTVDVSRKLEVPNLFLVVNMALPDYDFEQMKTYIGDTYNASVLGVLPLSEDVAGNASNNLFSMINPDHAWSKTIRDIADQLVAASGS
jgi:MinD-like ATPase involved in chromosome partitioning or flagellar assembly